MTKQEYDIAEQEMLAKRWATRTKRKKCGIYKITNPNVEFISVRV